MTSDQNDPDNPIAAATHPDPANYYAQLANLFFDSRLNAWVAASSVEVRQVLSTLWVRPREEPVPGQLQGSYAGVVFAKLVRMNDGAVHASLKQSIVAAINGCSPNDIKESTRQIAAGYPWASLVTGPLISQFCYAMPSMVLAHWLGIAKQDWPDLIQAVNAFVRCVAPGGTDSEYKAGIQAAIVLENLIHQQLSKPGPLLGCLLAEVEQKGFGADWVVANAIGLLFQANEGCAGLIAQTLILADQHGNEMGIAELIALALQENPPIQNTRRFAATDQLISGCPVQAGQTVLAILAAKDQATGANNAFGFAAHACPGEYWAHAMAEAAVEHLLQLDFDRSILRSCCYRRSINARVPEFTGVNRP